MASERQPLPEQNFSAQTNGSVTVRVKGGLGNQLFQYAMGRSLCLKWQVPLYLDTAWFSKPQSQRSFKLDRFRINYIPVAFSKKQRLRVLLKSLVPVIGNNCLYLKDRTDYGQRRMSMNADTCLYLDGYWQASGYLEPYRDQLLNELNFPDEILSALPLENTRHCVSVHIRRGDYLNEPGAHIVTQPYIERSMQQFSTDSEFLFFSDDINWCKDHFKDSRIRFADNPSDIHDLAHMAHCQHHIIANSSFSWWGAWLNRSEHKRVIAPRPWTRANTHPDILPAHWETLPIS